MKEFLLVLTLFIFTNSAHALNWRAFEDPTGDLKVCFLENLNPNLLSRLSNGRPDKKGMRKKAKRAYQACSKFMDNDTNKKNTPMDSIVGKK